MYVHVCVYVLQLCNYYVIIVYVIMYVYVYMYVYIHIYIVYCLSIFSAHMVIK